MSETIREYDEKRNLIYVKYSNGHKYWYEHDENNNEIHYRHSTGFEQWKEYDKKGRLIYYKSFDKIDNIKTEVWYKYDKNNKRISITKQEFEQIKEREFLSREEVSIFELMEL